ncbi:MAG TPA: MFS transporter, partial [Afifellaceae bacterium]|nr:MFS transporter [Afifellaceae bacterium]
LAASGAQVTAVDLSANRLKRLAGNLDRLKLDAHLVRADILEWQPDEPFDAVLLDAPCSATGTIRRHPDIACLKSPEDIATLAALQARMLARAADWVKPGGQLVYCTCSLEPEEGEYQAAALVAGRSDYTIEPVRAEEIGGLEEAVNSDSCLRTLPFMNFETTSAETGQDHDGSKGMDGFFAARFRRSG